MGLTGSAHCPTEKEAAADARRDRLPSVVSEVARNYAELRGAQCRLKLAEKNIRIQSETLELVARREAGFDTCFLDRPHGMMVEVLHAWSRRGRDKRECMRTE